MSFLPPKPFNPPTTTVPILGPSSGNPKSFQDPKSVASIGSTIQAMTDQAKADTLYDAPPPKIEGFNGIQPWIVNTPACKREGFTDTHSNIIPAIFIVLGFSLILCSFMSKKR